MLNNADQIRAIAWKARKIGLSYGILSASISDAEKIQIYDEYEKHWTKENAKYVPIPKQKKNCSDKK